jgi:hypothetical protein
MRTMRNAPTRSATIRCVISWIEVIAQRARRRHCNCSPPQPVGRQVGMAEEHVPGGCHRVGQARGAAGFRRRRQPHAPALVHQPDIDSCAGRPSGEATKAAVTSSRQRDGFGRQGRGGVKRHQPGPARMPEQRVGPGQQSEERGIGQQDKAKPHHGDAEQDAQRPVGEHDPSLAAAPARPFNGMPRRGRAGPRGRQRSRRRTAPLPPAPPRTGPARRRAPRRGRGQQRRHTPIGRVRVRCPSRPPPAGRAASSAASAASARAASRRRCASTKPGRISSGSALQWASCCSASRAACSSGSSGRVRPKRSASPAKHRRGAGRRRPRCAASRGTSRAIDRGARGTGDQRRNTSRNRAIRTRPNPACRTARQLPRQLGRHKRGLRGRDHFENDGGGRNGCDHGVLNGVMGGIVMHFAEDHDLGRADPRYRVRRA